MIRGDVYLMLGGGLPRLAGMHISQKPKPTAEYMRKVMLACGSMYVRTYESTHGDSGTFTTSGAPVGAKEG